MVTTLPILALALWGATWAQPPATETRWRELPTPEAGAPIRARGDEPLRARCPDGTAPLRLAVVPGDLGAHGLLELSEDPPVRDGEGWWRFPLAPATLTTWRLDREGCRVQVAPTATSSRGLARTEHGAEAGTLLAQVLGTSALDRDDAALLEGSPNLASYLAIRPPGPHGSGLTHPAPSSPRDRVRWTHPTDGGQELWWHGEEGLTWRIRGPLRVRLDARALGALQQPLCLWVDEAPSCQPVAPLMVTREHGGAPVREAVLLGEQELAQRTAWRLLLGDGEHTLRLDRPVLAELTTSWPMLYTDGVEDAGLGVTIVPDGEHALTTEQSLPVEPIPEAGVPQAVLRTEPATPGRPLDPAESRWVSLESLATVQGWARPRSQRLELWLEPQTPDHLCTVALPGDSRFTARAPSGISAFVHTGDDLAPDALPSVTGCDARLRVQGLDTTPEGAWTVASWTRTAPEGRLRWTLDPSLPTTTAFVAAGTTRALELMASDGARLRLTLVPGPVDADSLHLQWDAGWSWVEVSALEPITMKVSQQRHDAATPLDSASTASGPTSNARTSSDPDALRHLSQAIAAAPSDQERSTLLAERAALLAALGEPRLAWIDAARAALMGGHEDLLDALADTVAARTAASMHGTEGWMPSAGGWVAIVGEQPTDEEIELVQLASRGDALAVALHLDAAGRDARAWWRRAILDGQILTGEQRLLAHRALVAHSPQEQIESDEHWPLRLLSTWDTVDQVRGGRRDRRVWPDPVEEQAALVADALFPQPWPTERTQALRSGWELALPADSTPRELGLRCRATTVAAVEEPCRFILRDPRGAVLAEATASAWGETATLVVPPSKITTYLAYGPERGVVAQALLPGGTVATLEGAARSAVEIAGGRPARMELLGPGSLKLDTWCTGADPCEIEVDQEHEGQLTRTRWTTRAVDRHIVPLAGGGPVVVSIRSEGTVRFVPSMRVPSPLSRPIPGDVALLAGAQAGQSAAEATRAEPAGLPTDPRARTGQPPEPRPIQRPPATVLAGLRIGSDDVGDDPGEEALDTTWRGGLELGLLSRPTTAPIWLEVRGLAERGLADDGLTQAATGLDWRLGDRTWSTWLVADLRMDHGRVSDQPVSTGTARLRLSTERSWPSHWQAIARLQGQVRGLLGGTDGEALDPTEQPRLWSSYIDDHPRALQPSVELRYQPGPWLRLSAQALATSNGELAYRPVERVGAGLRADLGAPGLWLKASARLDRRFADAHRDDPYLAPELALAAAWTPWPHRDVGLQLSGTAMRRPVQEETLALFTLRLLASRDRALDDLRPSRRSFPHAATWGQDGAAARAGTAPIEGSP